MSHFNLKSLTFYSVMIGSVLILFKGVTAYGESSLKAPKAIGGTYQLTSSDLPDCLQSQRLTLTIEQSGLYIAAMLTLEPIKSIVPSGLETGNLAKSDAIAPKPQTIKLNGIMQSQPFTLSGKTAQLGNCLAANPRVAEEIQLQTSFQENNLLEKLQWSALNLNFTGQSQPAASKSETP